MHNSLYVIATPEMIIFIIAVANVTLISIIKDK
jgi:hypothetical protein